MTTDGHSAQTESMPPLSDTSSKGNHRRQLESQVSRKLETPFFLATVALISGGVCTALTMVYLFVWVAITNGQSGVAPGFFTLIGAFLALAFLALTALTILFSIERYSNVR